MSTLAHNSADRAARPSNVADSDGALALVFAFMVPIILVTAGVWAAIWVNDFWPLVGVLALDVICTVFVVWVTIRYLQRDSG